MSVLASRETFRSDAAPLMGMLLAAAAFAILTSVDTFFKLLAAGHPPYQILLVNGVFSVLPVVLFALMTGGLNRLYTTRPVLHLSRGILSVASAFFAIYAYARLPLTDYYAIAFSGPLIVTVLSSLCLREKIDMSRWIAILVGFCGVLIIADRSDAVHAQGEFLGRFVALMSVSCYALSVIIVRRMRAGESSVAFSFYGYVSCVLIGAPLLIILGAPSLRSLEIAHLAISGCLAGVSSLCLMTAYHRSPVSLVAPFQYTQIVWGALAGWLIWQQVPSQNLVAGAAIVASSGLYVIYREIRMIGGAKNSA